MIKNEQFP